MGGCFGSSANAAVSLSNVSADVDTSQAGHKNNKQEDQNGHPTATHSLSNSDTGSLKDSSVHSASKNAHFDYSHGKDTTQASSADRRHDKVSKSLHESASKGSKVEDGDQKKSISR